MKAESYPLVRRVGLQLAAVAVGLSLLAGMSVADVAAAPSPPAGMVNPKPAPPGPAPPQAKPKQQAPPAPQQQAPAPEAAPAKPAPPAKQHKPIATPDRGPNKSEPKIKAQPAAPPTKKKNKNRNKSDDNPPATALDQTETPSTPTPSPTTTPPTTTPPTTSAPPKRTTVQPGPDVPQAPTSITGRTKHGEDQITGRDGGRGVSDQAIDDAFNTGNPIVERDAQGRYTFKYEGPNARVILNEAGEIVTAIATNRGGWRNTPPPSTSTSPPPVVTVPQAPTIPPLPTPPPLPEIKVPTVPWGTCGELGGYILCMPPDPDGPATA